MGPSSMIRFRDNTCNMGEVDPTLDDWVGNHIGTHLSACPLKPPLALLIGQPMSIPCLVIPVDYMWGPH